MACKAARKPSRRPCSSPLAALLDRLGAARECTSWRGSPDAISSYTLLRDVAGLDEDPLFNPRWSGLPKPTCCLSRALLLQANYRFKHALIQDAAYDSLLKSRRRGAPSPRRRNPARESASPEAEAIAHHFHRRPVSTISAIDWWGRAGDQALRRSAFQEATAHLGKAIRKWQTRRLAPATSRCRGPDRRLLTEQDCQLHAAYAAASPSRTQGAGAARRRQRRFRKRARGCCGPTRMRRNGWRPSEPAGAVALCGPSCQGTFEGAQATAFRRDRAGGQSGRAPKAGRRYTGCLTVGHGRWFARAVLSTRAKACLERALSRAPTHAARMALSRALPLRTRPRASRRGQCPALTQSWPLGDGRPAQCRSSTHARRECAGVSAHRHATLRQMRCGSCSNVMRGDHSQRALAHAQSSSPGWRGESMICRRGRRFRRCVLEGWATSVEAARSATGPR